MSPEQVVELLQRTLSTAVLVATPLLGSGMAVGLVIAIFQAATQIQESSLNFVPKLVTIGLALAVGGPWILEVVVGFATAIIGDLANVPNGGLR